MFSVGALVRMIDDGVVGLPDFQRDFVWPPEQVAALLDSVGRGWPIGTLLLVPPVPDLAMRPITGAPSLRVDRVRYLVLDGQQRLTALYLAVRGLGKYDYSLNRNRLDEKDSLFQWHTQPEIEESVERRTRDRLTSYEVPCSVLTQELRVYELAQIFEAINTPGVPIDVFDLANARAGAIGEDLRKTWDRKRNSRSVLADFDVSALDILRLVALKSALEGRNLRGLRASDLLDLPADYMAKHWGKAIDEYADALLLLVENAGVVEPSDIPSGRAVLLTAALLAYFGPQRAIDGYWNNVLSPRDLSDREVLDAVSRDASLSTADSLRLANGSFGEYTRASSRMLSKALRNLARLNDALDPLDGKLLSNREIREFAYEPGYGITGRAVGSTRLDRIILLANDSAAAVRRGFVHSKVLPDYSLRLAALESQGFSGGSEQAGLREATLRRWVRGVVSDIV